MEASPPPSRLTGHRRSQSLGELDVPRTPSPKPGEGEGILTGPASPPKTRKKSRRRRRHGKTSGETSPRDDTEVSTSEQEYTEETSVSESVDSDVALRSSKTARRLRRTPGVSQMIPSVALSRGQSQSSSSLDLDSVEAAREDVSVPVGRARSQASISRKTRWKRARTIDSNLSKRIFRKRSGDAVLVNGGADATGYSSAPGSPQHSGALPCVTEGPLVYTYSIEKIKLPYDVPSSPFHPREEAATPLSWDESQIRQLLRELPPEHRKRYRIVLEWCQSEWHLHQRLRLIADKFLTPLRVRLAVLEAADETTEAEKAFLASRPLSAFGNAEVLAHLVQRCADAVAERIHPATWSAASTFGDLICSFLTAHEFVRVLHTYASTHQAGLSHLYQAAQSLPSSPFGTFVKQEQILAANLCLGQLLQAPMLHILRYQRFLDDLLATTPSQHRDRPLLHAALENSRAFILSLHEVQWRHHLFYLDELRRKCEDMQIPFFSESSRRLYAQGEIRRPKRASEPLWLFVFQDMLLCVSHFGRGASKLKLMWATSLGCATITPTLHLPHGDALLVRASRPIDEPPYLVEEEHTLLPSPLSPFEFPYWKAVLTGAQELLPPLESLSVLLAHLHRMRFGAREHLLLSTGAEEEEFSRDEALFGSRMPTSIHHIRSGTVRVERRLPPSPDAPESAWVPVGLLPSGSWVGEAAYLLPEDEYEALHSQFRYVAHSDEVATTEWNHCLLDYLFSRNPRLEPRFYLALALDLMAFRVSPWPSTPPLPPLPVFARKFSATATRQKEKAAYEAKLRLGTDDEILAQVPCKLKRDVRSGVVVLMRDSLLLSSSFLGHVSGQAPIEYADIQDMLRPSEDALELVWLNGEDEEERTLIHFTAPRYADEVYHLLVALTRDNSSHNRDEFFVHSMSSHLSRELDLSPQDMDALLLYGHSLQAAAGQAIFEQGQWRIPLCYLREGSVTLSRAVPAYGREELHGVGIRSAGQFFGQEACFAQSYCPYEAVALEACTYQEFSLSALQDLEDKEPELAARFFRRLATFLTSDVRSDYGPLETSMPPRL